MLRQNLNIPRSSQSYKKGKIRFLFLFAVVLAAFGNDYAFNNPQALQESLYSHLQISQTQFNLFYSLYSFPNIFTLFFVGYYLDKIGMRIGLIVLSLGIVICQLIVAIGGQIESYGLMLFGRIIYGIASRSLFIPQTALISFWFRGRQLSFALGIVITFPQLGNAFNSFMTPLLYDKTQSIGIPLFYSAGICFIGFIGAAVAFKLDKKAENYDLYNDIQSQTSQYSLETSQSKHQKIKLSDVRELNATFWIISTLCTLTMTQYIPFLDNANRYFQKRFCFTQVSSGKAVMITYIATALISGPLGLLISYIGKRRYLIMLATFIFLTAHTYIWLYPQCTIEEQNSAIWGLLLIGIGYSFYANVIVPAIPMVVQKKVLGTAIGIMQILSSIAECVIPLVTAIIYQKSESAENGFKNSSLMFFIIGLCGLLTSFCLFFIEKRFKRKLDKGTMNKQESISQLKDYDVPSQYTKIEQDIPQYNNKTIFNFLKNKQSTKQIQLSTKQLY